MTDTEPRQRRVSLAYLPFRILSWTAGALSVANLITDLDWVSLRGLIARWVESYERIVTKCTDFLFGWITKPGYEISEPEAHVLVLTFLFLSAIARGSDAGARARGEPVRSRIAMAAMESLPTVFIVPLLAVMFTGSWGLWVSMYSAVLLGGFIVFVSDDAFYRRREALLYLVGVVGVCLLIILGGTLMGG